jgi:hypothetical protein
MASATIGGVPPTHTSAAGYLLGKLLHDGNGKAKLPSSLKFKNLECADISFRVGEGCYPTSNRMPMKPEVTDYLVEVTPG